jgi:hypothetical protein
MIYGTRENEKPCICDGCNSCPEECGYVPQDCEDSMREAAAEEAREARRDA